MDSPATIARIAKPHPAADAAALLNAIPFPALLVHTNGTIERANDTLATLLGWTHASANAPLAATFPPESVRTVLGSTAPRPLPSPVSTIDGRPLALQWMARPVAGGSLHLLIALEGTRERALEDYLVANQCFEVSAALSGGLAHDFNNVLAAILGLAELISLRLPDDSPLQGFATRIGGSIERAKVLVRRFSQFSRKGTGVIEPQPIAMILQEIEPLIGAFLPGNIPIELALAEDTPWAQADRHVVEQIILNCANFLRTQLRGEGGRFLLGSSRAPNATGPQIRITGSGGGFSGTQIDNLFELDLRPTQTAYESGAGLFAARQLAVGSGGSLEIRRDDPRTISFILTLPAAD